MAIYSPYTDWYTAGYDAYDAYYLGRQAPLGLRAKEADDWNRGYADAYHDYNDFGDHDD